MITDEGLKIDKDKITEEILQAEDAINQRQQELQLLQAQVIRLRGVLDYIQANIPKPKDGEE